MNVCVSPYVGDFIYLFIYFRLASVVHAFEVAFFFFAIIDQFALSFGGPNLVELMS